MSAAKLLTELSASAAIADEVGTRIELVPVQQGLATPFISYEFEGDDPVNDLSGTAAITRQDWTIYATAKTFTVAERIKNTIINELTGSKTEFFAAFISSDHTYDDDSDTHQFSLLYRLTY